MTFPLGRLIEGEGRIQHNFVEFARLWTDVKEDWQDDRCRQFEKDHLSTIGPSLGRFTTALHEFTEQIRKAENALRDDFHSSEELN